MIFQVSSFHNSYKSKCRSHAWCNISDIIGCKKISRRFERSHDSCHSSRKFDRIWNLKFIGVQESLLPNKCCKKKMATSYRIRTSIQGSNCKPRLWLAWNNFSTRNGKFLFLSNATTCPLWIRDPPSWAWQEYNRLLRLGRPWGAFTLSRLCVSGDRGWCSARRGL